MEFSSSKIKKLISYTLPPQPQNFSLKRNSYIFSRKKTQAEKISYISGNGTFLPQA